MIFEHLGVGWRYATLRPRSGVHAHVMLRRGTVDPHKLSMCLIAGYAAEAMLGLTDDGTHFADRDLQRIDALGIDPADVLPPVLEHLRSVDIVLFAVTAELLNRGVIHRRRAQAFIEGAA